MHVLNWAQKRIRLLRQLAGLDPAIERKADAIEAAWNEVGQETAAAAQTLQASPAPVPTATAPTPVPIPQYVAPRPEPAPIREHAEPEPPPQPAPVAKSLASYLE